MEFGTDQQLKVGLFVGVGALIMALFIMFLGEGQFRIRSTIHLRVMFHHTTGLNRGSQVSLAGLKVGTVKKVEFAEASSDLVVTLEIDRDFQSRITEGAQASVKTLGALGDKYVYISPGEMGGKPLEDGALIPSDGGDDFLDVISKKSGELTNLIDVVKEVHTLLKSLNQDGRTGQLVQNLSLASKELKSFLQESRQSMITPKMKEGIEHFSSVMSKIDRGEGTLGALINDPTLHNKLSTMLGESPRRQFLKPVIRDANSNSKGP